MLWLQLPTSNALSPRRVWFQGATDMEQLSLVFSALGVPNERMWPGVSLLKTYVPFKEKVRAACAASSAHAAGRAPAQGVCALL